MHLGICPIVWQRGEKKKQWSNCVEMSSLCKQSLVLPAHPATHKLYDTMASGVLTFGYVALWDVFKNQGGCHMHTWVCENSVHWPQCTFHEKSSPTKVHYCWQEMTSPSRLIPLEHIASDHQVIKFRLRRQTTAKLHFVLIQTHYLPCRSTHVKSKENKHTLS